MTQGLYVKPVWSNGDRESHSFRCFPRAAHMEGNLFRILRRHIDRPQLALRPIDNRLVIGSPGEARIHSVDGPRLLHVAIESIEQWPFGAGRNITHEQDSVGAYPPDEGEVLTIAAGSGPRRATRAIHVIVGLTGSPVETANTINTRIGILV